MWNICFSCLCISLIPYNSHHNSRAIVLGVCVSFLILPWRRHTRRRCTHSARNPPLRLPLKRTVSIVYIYVEYMVCIVGVVYV